MKTLSKNESIYFFFGCKTKCPDTFVKVTFEFNLVSFCFVQRACILICSSFLNCAVENSFQAEKLS